MIVSRSTHSPTCFRGATSWAFTPWISCGDSARCTVSRNSNLDLTGDEEVVMGRMVSFKADGRAGDGYLATPKGDHGPAVIVIQEWWGLVDHIKDLCERISHE